MDNKSLKDIMNDFVNKVLQKQNYYIKLGVASDVSGFAFTFTPNDSSPILEDVPVSVVGTSTDSFVIIPEEDSLVLAGYTAKETPYCFFTEKAQKIYMNAPEIILNEGDNGGLVNIEDMVSRFNDLEGLHDQLQLDFNTWVPVPSDGGAALKAILSVGYLTKTVPSSTIPEFEDTKVTH